MLSKTQSKSLVELLAQAEQRRQLLAELVKTHPDEVLRVAIPAKNQAGLSDELLALHEAARSAKEPQSGQRVRLNGLLIPPTANAERADDGDIVVGSFDEDILRLAAGNSASFGTRCTSFFFKKTGAPSRIVLKIFKLVLVIRWQ